MHVLNTFLTSILYFILLNQTHYHFYTNAPTTTTTTCGEGGVEREARTRHQDVLTVVRKSRDRDVQSTRATGTQDHVVRGDLVTK